VAAQLIWRKTEKLFALTGWSGINTKNDLPYEYVYGDGPKFSYVPPTTLGTMHYNEFVQLGEDLGKKMGKHDIFADKLYIGVVLTHDERIHLMDYLKMAGIRLSQLRKEVEKSTRVVDAI
jgi:hypothetical protein